ncbi:Lipoprotein [Pseudomonas amygdali pv. lachrymans]|nr:lipoprotein, putative [Pseudomonas amygdali pv. lachrymans str. M302278]KPC05566.1 Lipoprotein [Pseudomonas amygdali pv. lachrymans]
MHERSHAHHEYVEEVIAPQAPPERVIEVEPAARPGYVWARGYWHWNGERYVPVHGHWEVERPGYRYVHPHWESAGDGWHWHAGVWAN